MLNSSLSSWNSASVVERLQSVRELTLELVSLCTDDELKASFDPDFSPVGWHFGHLVAFEALWAVEHVSGKRVASLSDEWRRLFNPRENPKSERGELPSRNALMAWGREVRHQVIELAETTADPTFFKLALAHELQHTETMATILRMRPDVRRRASGWSVPQTTQSVRERVTLQVPAGAFVMGAPGPDEGYDNERPAREVTLAAFCIDSSPVTNAEWLEFIEDGGYLQSRWWSRQGWAWRQRAGVQSPSSWRQSDGQWILEAFGGDVPLPLSLPVEGVSAHEADAYAHYCGARLPTEAQWECAARLFDDGKGHLGLRVGAARACGEGFDFLGNVWEWTSTTFAPYPGFVPYPYEGYSVPWFDGRHRVMRGGSWATATELARPTFRNWYEPHWRRMFAGLRLVREG